MAKKNKRKRSRRERKRRSAPRRKQSRQTVSLEKIAEEIKREGFLSDAQLVINPPGYEKMSEVLGRFIEPYVDETENLGQYEKLVALAASAWNAALMPADQRAAFINDMLPIFPAEDQARARSFLNELIRRKQTYFADINRYIIDYRVTDLGDSYHLAVASSMPDEGKA